MQDKHLNHSIANGVDSRSLSALWPAPLTRLWQQSSKIERLTFAAIVTCLALQFHLLFVQEINWDEFFFLSRIYDYQRGVLSEALQTFHVHLFGWLSWTGFDEAGQIRTARAVMWFVQLGTLGLIYATARAFVSKSAALLSVLAFLGAGLVFLYGTSFRTDPIAAFLMMVCVFLLTRSRLALQDHAIISFAAALGLLITIKVAFFAPTLIGIGLWRVSIAPDPAKVFFRLALCALAVIAVFGALYGLHAATLSEAKLSGSQSLVSSSLSMTLLSAGLFPRSDVIFTGALSALAQTFLLAAGLVLAGLTAVRPGPARKTALVLLAFVLPLASFIFYRNAFPYFVGFIFPPAMILVGYGADRLKLKDTVLAGLVAIMGINGVSNYVAALSRGQTVQDETISVVHQMFAKPVAYIDRCSMVSTFPKVGFFMSSWGFANYLQAGMPLFEPSFESAPVPLLIVNSPLLANALGTGEDGTPNLHLLADDVDALRRNFIPHWGPIWVAGKKLSAGKSNISFAVEIPGLYTVESAHSVIIDDLELSPGATVLLARGAHSVRADVPGQLVLRWGDHIFRPGTMASTAPLFATL